MSNNKNARKGGSIFCNGLYWEPEADQNLVSYDQGLERVRKAGYERYPRSAEVMQVLKAGLEGKLTGEAEVLFQDMCTLRGIGDEKVYFDEMGIDVGGWVSEAIKKTIGFSAWHLIGHKIAVLLYHDPKGIAYDPQRRAYVNQNFAYSERQRFDLISYVIMETFKYLPDAFIQSLYGSAYNDLPNEMRGACSEVRNTRRWLSDAKDICPLAYHPSYLNERRIWLRLDSFAVSRGVSTKPMSSDVAH